MSKIMLFSDQDGMAGYETRTAEHEGRAYLVAPCVLMVEGVHDGGQGPLFYSAEQLGMFPEAWNGSPVTAYHPRQDGGPISANSPEVLSEWQIGMLFNTQYDEAIRGLRSEVWVDIEKCQRVHPQTLRAIQAGEPLENSTGLWDEHDGVGGTWNEIEYQAAAMNIRPDHHALLWGGTGACSLADGCGVRANEEVTTMGRKDKPALKLMLDGEEFGVIAMDAAAKKQEQFEAQYEPPCLCAHAMDMQESVRALQRMADAMDKDVPGGRLYHYVRQAFTDGTLVMMVENTGSGETKFFKMTYTMEDETPTALGDEMEEVRLQQEYVPVTNDGGDGNPAADVPPKTNDEPETEEVHSMAGLKDKVDALIGHAKSVFTEDNRDALMGFSEEQVDALVPVEDEPPTDEPPVDEPPVDEPPADEPRTMEQHLADMPSEMADMVRDGLTVQAARKATLVTGLKGHASNPYTEAELNAMSPQGLENLSKLAGIGVDPKHNFTGGGAGGPPAPQAHAESPVEGLKTPTTHDFFKPLDKGEETH